MKVAILVFSIVSLVGICTGQDNPCAAVKDTDSCDDCISTSYLCSWCPYAPNDTIRLESPRCALAADRVCVGNITMEHPQPSMDVVKDEPLSTEASFESIQVSPQNITLNLRAKMAEKFNMTFVSLRNAPLDIYILLDLSSSLAPILRVLRMDLAQIANSLGNISSDFQMGFGSFVDKNTRPFALWSYEENDTINGIVRCKSFGQCVPTYSFRNSQPLTGNITEIVESIQQYALLSSNVDAPEGGLEALLQVAGCTNETGWRPNALHIVFLITDQGYHLAGDGKLAGINKPNDGKCHLAIGEGGRLEYNYGLLQDYPSVFQLQDVLVENNVVPIFACQFGSAFLDGTYGQLIQDLRRAQARYITFGLESADEIIRVIRSSYDETVQSIRVIEPGVPGYSFKITPIDGCDTLSADQPCILQFDERVTFEVSVTVEDCSKARPVGVQLRGPPFSFSFINLNPICECNCSKQSPELNSDFCNTRGDLQCGQCDCEVNKYFGESCECNTTIMKCETVTVDKEEIVCSGLGTCSTCGECQCINNTFGTNCECNEQSCPGNCNGNGLCLCETNPRCLCDIEPVSKFRYFDKTVGDTGSCRCNPVDCFNHQYPGELCHNVVENKNGTEYCVCAPGTEEARATCSCPGGLVPVNSTCAPETSFCSIQELCARCAVEEIANSSCGNCRISRFIELLDDIEAPVGFNLECAYPAGSCTYTFSFMQEDLSGDVYYNRQCSATILPWVIAGSLVGLIVLVGILSLICLKIGFVVWDRIEYKKFTKDLSGPDFTPHENPLYLTPQQDYPNPLRRASRRKKEQEEETQD